jgi:hypothetical protein
MVVIFMEDDEWSNRTVTEKGPWFTFARSQLLNQSPKRPAHPIGGVGGPVGNYAPVRITGQH